MPDISGGLQSAIAGGSPFPSGGGLGEDPELIADLQEVLANMPPEQLGQLQQMSPEELGNFLFDVGVPEEDMGEAIDVLGMLLQSMGGGQQPIDVQGQQGEVV